MVKRIHKNIFPLRTWRLCALAGGISKSENFRPLTICASLANFRVYSDTVFAEIGEFFNQELVTPRPLRCNFRVLLHKEA
jgi:hypothetical protein